MRVALRFCELNCLLIYVYTLCTLYTLSSFLLPPSSFLLLHSSFLYLRRPLFRCLPWSLPQCLYRCVSIKPFNKSLNTLMIILHIFHNTQTRRNRVTHRVHLLHTYSTYRILTRTYSTPYTRLYWLPSYLFTLLTHVFTLLPTHDDRRYHRRVLIRLYVSFFLLLTGGVTVCTNIGYMYPSSFF